MDAYNKFYDKYSKIANIYIIYILEAHFVEKDENGNFIGGWPIGYQYNYEQPKTLEQRQKMVSLLVEDFQPKIPIYMDNMKNDFQNIYRPWPDRAFLFTNNKLVYSGEINKDGSRNGYFTDDIALLLDANVNM
jgi:hypothetical protein